MLSYQHAFHAGNLADVHKHALLAWMLDYMTQKPKPFSYLETHAGRALYDLADDAARKTGEAAKGIAIAQDWFPTDHPYSRALSAVRAAHGASAYPGSPRIAQHLLRPDDPITLAELHPAEAAALRKTLPTVRVVQADGFATLRATCPPTPRRGLMLCDPSYEIKSDYNSIPGFFQKLHRSWPVGVLVLWYPILPDARHLPMIRALKTAHPKALCHEVRFPPLRPGKGMIGSGLFVVNPPYGLQDAAHMLSAQFAQLSD